MYKLPYSTRTTLPNLTKNMCKCSKKTASKEPQYKRVTHCIFDVDGTLINSQVIYKNILTELCAKYGERYPEEIRLRMAGATKRKLCETLVKDLQLNVTSKDLEEQFLEMAAARLPQAPLQKGVDRLVTHLYKHKVPIALATNSSRVALSALYEVRPEFFNKFHHLVTVEDVNFRGKPEPDLFLLAAARFPKPALPTSCLVFEDTTNGLRAAIAAKMQVVLTPHMQIIDGQYVNAYTHIIPDLRHFRPENYGLPAFINPS